MTREVADAAIAELVALGREKGAKYGSEHTSAYALGYLQSVVMCAVWSLPESARVKFIDEIKRSIVYGREVTV